ncbi:MAG: hypothetical protein ABEI74_04810 [Candidatus Pacearchaeota archaeon]
MIEQIKKLIFEPDFFGIYVAFGFIGIAVIFAINYFSTKNL